MLPKKRRLKSQWMLEGNDQVPDILINNAAITKDNLFLRMKSDEWHDVLDTNLNSVDAVKACLRKMLKASGQSMNIGSYSWYH